jgi:dolichol kinase/splicing factor 3B subunit 1
MFTDSHERLALCAYWICVIYVSVRRFYSISKQSKTERILLRKYYHLVAVLIFSPAVIFQVICALFFIVPFPSMLKQRSMPIRIFSSLLWKTVHVLQPAFLDLAFGAAFAVFLTLEMIRVRDILLSLPKFF